MDNSIESLSINRSYTIEEFFRLQSPSDLSCYFSIPEAVYLRESEKPEKNQDRKMQFIVILPQYLRCALK